MAGRYKAYPVYKKINIETVKELPEKWAMKSLGLLALNDSNSFVDGPFGSDLKSTEYEDFGIPLIQLNNIKVGSHALQNMKYISESKKNELLRHVAKPNDIVIAKMAEPVARAALVNDLYDEYVIVADCVRLSVNQVICNLNYVVYAINSKEINSLAELASSGTTRIRINLSELKKLRIPFPSFSEQQTIAQFLDYETAKIDALIAKQEQLIELLKEKRQAVISHAVTKGLNPDAPMKDSGVEWLGQVPEHWEVVRMRFICQITTGGRDTQDAVEDGEYPFFVRSENIQRINTYSFDGEGVMTSGDGAGVGKIFHYFVGKCEIHQRVYLFHKFKKITGKYFYHFLKEHLEPIALAKSAKSTVDSLRMPILQEFPFSFGTIKEQEEICSYIESQEKTIEDLTNQSWVFIKILQERKTALISAAVTGKIDVRDWQPPSVG